ncbi:MAG TPA: hypothetical protein VN441_03195 [Syntrophomonas sp.]|nr:hypothetical protein [Syntrophomonas sp.]
MKERGGKKTLDDYYEFGRQCTYCRALKSQEYELCKQCWIYKQGLAYISGLWPEKKKISTGESLARFDFTCQEMIKLYCQAGFDGEQIKTIMEKLVMDNVKLITE